MNWKKYNRSIQLEPGMVIKTKNNDVFLVGDVNSQAYLHVHSRMNKTHIRLDSNTLEEKQAYLASGLGDVNLEDEIEYYSEYINSSLESLKKYKKLSD